jgi:hypothetical protein
MEGNIFGNFTLMEWDSHNGSKADNNKKSFIFTLKNPYKIESKRFVLKPGEKHRAIYCHSRLGPCFGGGCDSAVLDDSSAKSKSHTIYFGSCYINNMEFDGRMFLIV